MFLTMMGSQLAVQNEAEHYELARLLLADIHALVPLVFPHRRPVLDAHVRLMAVTMRRWLVDGDLQKLLDPLRQPALFDVQGNEQAQAYAAKSGAFRYYLTAGIKANGVPVRHFYESPLPYDAVDRRFTQEGRINLTLKRFLAQRRLFHDGHWFTTAQILRFVANKLGGNHLDFDRSGEWAGLDAANKFLCYGGPNLPAPPDGSEIYLILEPNGHEVIGGVHLEIMAAAASFVQMKIGEEQLVSLEFDKSLLGRLRKLFERRPEFCMIERPSG